MRCSLLTLLLSTLAKMTRPRTLGWVQDAADFRKLREVVQLFSHEGNAALLIRLDSKIRLNVSDWATLRKRLGAPDPQISYRELIGSKGKMNGLIPALLPGQSAGRGMSTWASSAFIYWAHVFGFVTYDRASDLFALTDLGKSFLSTTSGTVEETQLLREGLSAYPPAVRLLSILNGEDRAFTKYELGSELGFMGERGFTSYNQKMIVEASRAGEIKNPMDTEGTADKYARMICGWFQKLGLATSERSDRTGITQNEFRITYAGKNLLNHVCGMSRHSAVAQRVCWEMLATKTPGRDYLRSYRFEILRQLTASAIPISSSLFLTALSDRGYIETELTLLSSLRGLQRIGIRVEETSRGWRLAGSVILDGPRNTAVTAPVPELAEIAALRSALKRTPEKYLALIPLSVSGKKGSGGRDFEIMLMEYFIIVLGLPGRWLGGGSRPGGVVHVDHRGVVIDAKSYTNGYPLPTKDQDSMVRYVRECRDRIVRSGEVNAWWHVFPSAVNCFTYAFVSGSFKATAPAGIANIKAHLGGTRGNLLRVRDLLEAGDKFLAEKTPLGERLNELFYALAA